jgi:hypothetical protein
LDLPVAVVLFRDASANKGGVTSSSLEVLSGMALDDAQFIDLMTSAGKDGLPEFYQQYARSIQDTSACTPFCLVMMTMLTLSRPCSLQERDCRV